MLLEKLPGKTQVKVQDAMHYSVLVYVILIILSHIYTQGNLQIFCRQFEVGVNPLTWKDSGAIKKERRSGRPRKAVQVLISANARGILAWGNKADIIVDS